MNFLTTKQTESMLYHLFFVPWFLVVHPYLDALSTATAFAQQTPPKRSGLCEPEMTWNHQRQSLPSNIFYLIQWGCLISEWDYNGDIHLMFMIMLGLILAQLCNQRKVPAKFQDCSAFSGCAWAIPMMVNPHLHCNPFCWWFSQSSQWGCWIL